MLKTLSITLAAPDDDGVAQSQTPAAGGVQSLTLNGALQSTGFDVARRIAITSTGNDSGRTFTVTGLARDGLTSISETITGANAGSAYSVYDYKSIASVTVDANTANAVKVGTCDRASTDWIPLDRIQNPFSASISCNLSSGASLTYTAEYTTYDFFKASWDRETNYNVRYAIPNPSAHIFAMEELTSKITSLVSNFIVPVVAVRLTLNAFTSGTASITANQAGV